MNSERRLEVQNHPLLRRNLLDQALLNRGMLTRLEILEGLNDRDSGNRAHAVEIGLLHGLVTREDLARIFQEDVGEVKLAAVSLAIIRGLAAKGDVESLFIRKGDLCSLDIKVKADAGLLSFYSANHSELGQNGQSPSIENLQDRIRNGTADPEEVAKIMLKSTDFKFVREVREALIDFYAISTSILDEARVVVRR